MESEHKSGKQREITYHVGWKKGRIQGTNRAESLAKDGDSKEAPIAGKLFQLCQRYLWREAPAVRHTWLFPLLFLLPVLIFALTFILVFILSNI